MAKKKNKKPSIKPKKVEKQANPFEIRANKTRKKFEVLNRRVKGENRNVANARAKAIERRKRTLLVDYNETKKKNSFQDRRFGENDPSLSLEDKLLARFQREKSRRARQGALFRLEDENEWGNGDDFLTHKGKQIGDDYEPEADEIAPVSDDDNVDAEATGALHFGGGSKKVKDRYAQQGAEGGEKSRKDIIDEIIAKSKAHKLEKARNREVQEVAVEALDNAFGELQGLLSSSQMMRPTGSEKKRKPLDEFDTLTREIAFEARARAADRTKTDEEVAKEEKERLEELERKRLARMKGEFEEADSDKDSKSKKKRKKPAPTDDDLNDEYEIDDRFGLKFSALQENMEVAGHEAKNSEDESINDTEDDEESSGEESDSESASSTPSGTGNNKNDDQSLQEERSTKPKQLIYRLPGSATEMPYVFSCPASMEDFLTLIEKYARSVKDVCTIIDRIVKCHNIKLAAENREKMHNFYDLLLRRFIMVGDNLVGNPKGISDLEEELDFLTKTVVLLTRQMADVAGTLWLRLLKTMHRSLGKQLRDFGLGLHVSCWPSCGHLLLLQLMGDVFPTSDLRHLVTTPAMLLLGQYLAQCPATCPGDLVAGMFCCTLMVEFTAEAKRLVPEVVAFLHGVFMNFTAFFSDNHVEKIALPSLTAPNLTWLRPNVAKYSKPQLPKLKLHWLALQEPAQMPAEKNDSQKDELSEIAASVLATSYHLAEECSDTLNGSQAFPELFQPIQEALAKMAILKSPKLPKILAERHVHLMEKLEAASKKCLDTRRPLCWQVSAKKQVKMMAPKFEENYTVRKDKDADRDKAKIKQLKRQVKREKKGAMRELRRDAEFLEQEKWKEFKIKNESKKQKLRENMAWLEDQTANFNKQVKLGGGLLKGGGSGVKKFKR